MARAQGRGPASHLLRDQAGDSEAVPAVGGVRWSGVCLLSTHILWPVCHPGVHPRGKWWHPAGELGGAHQAGGKNEGHGGTVPGWGVQGKQNQIQTPSKSSHRRETEKKQPFLGGDPRPVLSPSPLTWSRTGSGSGSEHTHLCPLLSQIASGTDSSVGTGLRTMGVSRFSPSRDWLSVCPSHLDMKVSPAAPSPPRNHWWFGRRTGSTRVAPWPDSGTI